MHWLYAYLALGLLWTLVGFVYDKNGREQVAKVYSEAESKSDFVFITLWVVIGVMFDAVIWPMKLISVAYVYVTR